MPNPTQDYFRITLVCGPVDEFTFLVTYDELPDALEELAHQMRERGVALMGPLEEVFANDLEEGDLHSYPWLKSRKEIESYIVNNIDNDCGEGPTDGVYTVTCEDLSTYTWSDPENQQAGISPKLYFAWCHALAKDGPRPVKIDWKRD